MRRSRILKDLVFAVYLSGTTAGHAPNNIFERASTCADPSFTQCTQAGLPSSFCCPSNSACIPLVGNTTLLCCPDGSSCQTIQPITCDLTQQNATLHPSSVLKTTALSGTLPICGNSCCPFGFHCNTQGNCDINPDQQTYIPKPSNSTTSSTSSVISCSPNPTPISSSAAATNTSASLTATCTKFPIGAVLAGFFPGLILGILLTLASIYFLGAHRRKDVRRRSGSSFGNISEPRPTGDIRTDFLRKQPQTPSTDASSRGSTPKRRDTVQRVRSLFRKSTASNAPAELGLGVTPPLPLVVKKKPMEQEQEPPVTPRLQREPSYEDINIFADGDTASALREREQENSLGVRQTDARASHQTTFTDMMEKGGLAGLQKGQPYVYRGSVDNYSPSPPRLPNPRNRAV